MKPDWDRLAETYEGSSVLIADADCTVESELCQRQGVSGYPTIKYWSPETGPDGEKYQGGRDFNTLQAFVEENLGGGCEIDDEDSCSEKEVKFTNKMRSKGADAIAAQLTRLNGMKGKSMKAELKEWLHQRINILEQLSE